MKIVCVMTTEDRAPIWGIGLASFLSQWHADRHLLVVLPAEQEKAYQVAVSGLEAYPFMDRVHYLIPDAVDPIGNERGVPQRLDMGCKAAWDFGADLVAIQDDDDWNPPDWLAQANELQIEQFWDKPAYASYAKGWFVNLRTLRGELIKTFPHHLWGGTLIFNKAAWEQAGGFYDKPFPGQDRAFMSKLATPEVNEHHLCCKRGDPVAFSHGKNVATWLKSKGTQMEGVFKLWMPELVLNEVKRCQQLMIDTRTFPPQPEK
jgi:hypothetical protein